MFPLPSSKPGDDGSSSSQSGGEKEKEGAAISGGDGAAGGDGGGGTISGDGGAGAVSGDGSAGGETEDASGAGDDISGGRRAGSKGQCAGGDIIHATPISADNFTTWSPENWSGVPWMQVTLDKDSTIFLAATMAFTDPGLRKSHQAFKRSLSSAWEYVPKLGDLNITMDGLQTQLTEGQGLWFTGTLASIKTQEAQMDRNGSGKTHTLTSSWQREEGRYR